MRTRNIQITTLALVTASLAFAPSVFAQAASRTMTVVPPTIQASFNPGGKTEGTMKLINNSDETLTFNAIMRDYIVIDSNGTPNLLPPNTLNDKYSAAAWVGIAPSTFTLQPHGKQELQYFVQVPANARPGGHYTAVVFEPVNNSGIQGTGSVINTQIGTLFYVAVNGPITESAKVTNFSSYPFQEYGPVEIQTQITNYGDLHIKPQMTLQVTDIFGRTIANQPVDAKNIFPSSARDYVNVVGQQWMIGPFTAKLTGTYGKTNNLPLAAAFTFWVFPWKIAIIIIMFAIAIALGVVYMKKNKGGKPDHKEHKENPQEPKTPENPKA